MASRGPVSRRTYLGLAGGALSVLAGCSGGGDEPNEDTPSETTNAPTPTATTVGTTAAPETPTGSPTEARSAAIDRMESQIASVDFDGEYVDTHAHWVPSMGAEIPSLYAAKMAAHDIGATVLFSPSARAAADYESFLTQLTDPGVEYLPFMSAPPPGRRLGAELRSLYADTELTFWGIGEWKPQTEPFPPFDGERYTPLWELSADVDIPVMFHPKASQEGSVEPALQAHPDATFILHGHQMLGYGREGPGLGPTLPRLLREYENLYWQMDVGVMLSGRLLRPGDASTFVDWYDANAGQVIEIYRDILPQLLDAAPDRILWGTDLARPWNLTDEVFPLLMEFTDRVLEGVPAEHHAPYKRGNARRLFDR